MKKDFTYLPGDSQQNLREVQPAEEPMSTTKKITLSIIFIFLLALTAYNYLVIQSELDFEDRFQKQVDQANQANIVQQKQKLNQIEEMYNKTEQEGSCKVTLSDKAKQRISYGQPRPKNSSMMAVVIEKKSAPVGSSICAITNGVNIITSKTTLTAKNFLQQQSIHKWIVFIGLIDEVGDLLIRNLQSKLSSVNVIRAGEVSVDGSYEFVTRYTNTCSSIVYLQNTFIVDPDKAEGIVNAIAKMKEQNKAGYMGFTESAEDGGGLRKLVDLRHVDINEIKEQKLNQYIYMFDAKLLTVITPLNFVSFSKYTLEQILINPILALTQKSNKLIPISGKFHEFDEVVVQFKQFPIIQPTTASTCFVAYSSVPTAVIIDEIKQYLKSIKYLKANDKKIVLLISVPYNFYHQTTLFDVYQELAQLQMNPNVQIRLRIYYKRAVSSLTVYEAAHSYCPKSSLMVISRFNVLVNKQLFINLGDLPNEKYHFYYSGWPTLKNATQLKQTVQPLEEERYNIEGYMSTLSHMQLFTTEFFKMVNLWVLKSDADEFCESEISFVLPLLEMAGESIMPVKNLFTVWETRNLTEREQKQIKQLQKYSRWPKMQDNIIQPIPYNSLTNLDLRKGNHDQIPKIIHQVWFKDEEIPESIRILQDSIQQTNEGFEYRLWRKENLTSYDFPLSYALVARTLEYEWAYQKSYHAWVQALISYQILYNHGGIYIDLNAEGSMALDSFLKYELFFAGFQTHPESYSSPVSVGRQIMGAKRFSYHMRFILAELIREEALNYDCVDFEQIVGGGVVRLSLTDDELFTTVGFGFQLFNYDPFNLNKPVCSGNVPCTQFEQTYITLHDLQ